MSGSIAERAAGQGGPAIPRDTEPDHQAVLVGGSWLAASDPGAGGDDLPLHRTGSAWQHQLCSCATTRELCIHQIGLLRSSQAAAGGDLP